VIEHLHGLTLQRRLACRSKRHGTDWGTSDWATANHSLAGCFVNPTFLGAISLRPGRGPSFIGRKQSINRPASSSAWGGADYFCYVSGTAEATGRAKPKQTIFESHAGQHQYRHAVGRFICFRPGCGSGTRHFDRQSRKIPAKSSQASLPVSKRVFYRLARWQIEGAPADNPRNPIQQHCTLPRNV